MTLVEALEGVELEAGRTYHCRVRDLDVELRVMPSIATLFVPDPISVDDAMLDSWVELPVAGRGIAVNVRWGNPFIPDVPVIPDENESSRQIDSEV